MKNNNLKNIIIIILSIMLLLIIALLVYTFIYILPRYKKSNETLSQTNTELQSSTEQLKTEINDLNLKISELENTSNNLNEQISTLQTENEQIQNEKNELNSKLSTLQSKSASNKSTNSVATQPTQSNPLIGIWKNTVTVSETSDETNKVEKVTYTTLIEFKLNGDFYVNHNKVGTYKDGSILFKDSNDPNFRNASYRLNDNILYINLYENKKDICVSTDFYECKK